MEFSCYWLFLILSALSLSGWAAPCDGESGTPRCYIQIGSVLVDRATTYVNGIKDIKLCLSDGNRPKLNIKNFVEEINNLNDGKGFGLKGGKENKAYFYHINYTEITFPAGQWLQPGNCTQEKIDCLGSIPDNFPEDHGYCQDSELHCNRIGEDLSKLYFPQFHYIVGSGSGCGPDVTYVMTAATLANNLKRIWMTNRGPEIVITKDGAKPYVFSIHLNSDDYAKVALQQWKLDGLKNVAIFYEDNKGPDGVTSTRNDFFYGVGKGAVEAAELYELPIVVSGTFDDLSDIDTEVFEGEVDSSVDAKLASLVNASFDQKVEGIVLSSRRHVFEWLMDVLKSREAIHRFKGVFWVGVSWSGGTCNGVDEDICRWTIGATQTHNQDEFFFDDLVKRPANASNGESGIESDVYCGISTFVQVLQTVFEFSMTNASSLLDDLSNYEAVKSYMNSGQIVAKTWYGDVSFNTETGQNDGRNPVTVQAFGSDARTIFPVNHAKDVFVFPSPATDTDCPINTFMNFDNNSCPLCAHGCENCPANTITSHGNMSNANRIDCKCINNCTSTISVCDYDDLQCIQSDCTPCIPENPITDSGSTEPSSWTGAYTAIVVILAVLFVAVIIGLALHFKKKGENESSSRKSLASGSSYHDVRMMNPLELSNWLKENDCKEMAFAANTNNITGVMWLKQGTEDWENFAVPVSEHPRLEALKKSLKS